MLIAIGTQLAALTAVVGLAQTALATRSQDSAGLERGTSTLRVAARVLDATWSSPVARLLEYNPVTLGAVDDLRASAHAIAVGSRALDPAAQVGATILGFDTTTPLISGAGIDTTRLPDLVEPTAELHDVLAATQVALGEVRGTGLLGRPVGAVAGSLRGTVSDLTQITGAAEIALPVLPDALGEQEPKRYLICALNDAELFGSGGAPLFAVMVEAVRGSITIPLSGQLESKLSPLNPPIAWDHAAGPPWLRDNKDYPFVNSNFHPDFTTASVDMRRAWAALGYPEVEGVVTVDVNALAHMLAWAGPVDAGGHGTVSAETLIPKILVDAYRDFDSVEGRAERHARNDQLAAALQEHIVSPTRVLPAVRGALDAIPGRHIQAAFEVPELEAAVGVLAATGALADRSGDLVGAFSQSSPNKLSVFQDRRIRHMVQLTQDGGADIRRVVTVHNAVPPGAKGDPSRWDGYSALQARLRVAHRVPLGVLNLGLTTRDPSALVPPTRTGPFPDDQGGQVMWQGHEIPAGDEVSIEITYRLPPGTFTPGSYEVSADPQALTIPAQLEIIVTPAPGQPIPSGNGWTQSEGSTRWIGTLDRPLHLVVR
ncbi:MAG: DUF4012 domain-containing protein [Candidatus Nanopelagicales bacterium]|nr:DUF4012 domain-containing protein [Candidatus Nanopelagicales bacterium]